MRRLAPATIAAAFLLLLAVACAATANAAISFRLNSRDFVPWLEAKPVEPSYAMANAHNGVCVLVQLDNGLGGVIRFTYSSNVTDVRERADLLVSVHRPSTSAPSIAAIDGADKITDTKIFNAAQLHRTNVEANVVRRSKERHGINDVTAEEEMARSTTLTLRPVQDGTGPSAHFVDGNYAACFLLVARAANAANKKPAPIYEEVQLRLLEVASTSHSTSTYIARLSNPVVNQPGGDNLATEADREYAKMIRNLFRTNKNTNLQNLLNADAVVSSEEMHKQLEALKAVQQQLFSLYSSSEHLEERFLRMRSTAETTFTRIWLCMILTLAVMGATIWLTFYFTKDIIVKRKLI